MLVLVVLPIRGLEERYWRWHELRFNAQYASHLDRYELHLLSQSRLPQFVWRDLPRRAVGRPNSYKHLRRVGANSMPQRSTSGVVKADLPSRGVEDEFLDAVIRYSHTPLWTLRLHWLRLPKRFYRIVLGGRGNAELHRRKPIRQFMHANGTQ